MTRFPHTYVRKQFSLVVFCSLLFSSFASSAVQVIPRGYNDNPANADSHNAVSEKQLKAHFKKAVKAYRSELRAYWPDAEVSSKTRLVFYSEDLQQKQVVDFKSNEIQITTPSIYQGKTLNYREMQSQLKLTIKNLLTMNLQAAVSQDPINTTMEQLSGIRYAQDLGAMGKDLILGELFRDERPSIKAVERMAAKLSKAAYIRYPAVASLNWAFISSKRTSYIISLPDSRTRTKATRYKSFIYDYAQKYSLPPSLVFAIIHAESHFNPLARSQAPAFGLMQIMPHTAGLDASNLIYKKQKVLSPSYLYNPKKNVQVGAAYFHILYYRYLKGVTDSKARLYCAIAAYNAGTSSVMKALTGRNSINKAVPNINNMSANDVLRKLLRHMPSAETRNYLQKVLNLQKTYAQL